MAIRSVPRLALLVLLIPAAAAAQPSTGGCFDPVSFGAIPNDGIDDRAAFQAAIDHADGGGTVCIGPGRWRLNRAPGGSYNSHASLATHGSHIAIVCQGPGAVLELAGDQGLQQSVALSFDPSAHDIIVSNCKFSSLGAYRTEEQTHLIATSTICAAAFGTCKPIEDITLDHLTYEHPAAIAGERKGDCVRLGSNPETPVRRFKIIGGNFRSCARSAIELQGEVYQSSIIANSFSLEDGDQVIDGEATGGRWLSDILIMGNTFDDGPRMQGDYSVSLTAVRRAIVADNIFKSRGLILVRTPDSIVHHNIFDATMRYAQQAVIEVANQADRLRIDGNNVARHGLPGAGIRVQPHGANGPPSGVRVENNTIVLDGDSTGILVDSPIDLRIEDNDITLTAPTAPNGMGILVMASARDAAGIRVRGNAIVGASYHSAIRFIASAGRLYSGVSVESNISRGGARSWKCEENTAGTYAAPIVTGGNQWAVAASCSTASGPATLIPGD